MYLHCVHYAVVAMDRSYETLQEMKTEPGCTYCGRALLSKDSPSLYIKNKMIDNFYELLECPRCGTMHVVGKTIVNRNQRRNNAYSYQLIKMYVFYDEDNDRLPHPFDDIQNAYKFIIEPDDGTIFNHKLGNGKLVGLGLREDKFRFGRNKIEQTPEEYVFGDFPLENI